MCVNSGEADLPDRLRWSGLGQITGRSRQPVHSGVEGDEMCLRASAGVRARGTGHCLGPRCPSCWHLAPPPFLAWDGVGGLVGQLSSLSFRALGQGVAPCPPPWPSLGGRRSQGFFLSHTSFPWGGPALSCSRLWFPGHCPPAGVKMQRAAMRDDS